MKTTKDIAKLLFEDNTPNECTKISTAILLLADISVVSFINKTIKQVQQHYGIMYKTPERIKRCDDELISYFKREKKNNNIYNFKITKHISYYYFYFNFYKGGNFTMLEFRI